MNVEAQILEKHLKKTAVVSNAISIAIGLVTALSVGYGFYYNTNSTLQNHTSDITEIKKDVISVKNQMNDVNVFKGVSQIELDALQNKVDRMDEKLDQILMQTRSND